MQNKDDIESCKVVAASYQPTERHLHRDSNLNILRVSFKNSNQQDKARDE